MPRKLLFLSILALCACARPSPEASIHRLDGSYISFQDADAFARKTLQDAHVTGAELAVITDGKLAWSGAYGLRGRGPDLPMSPQTITWAASLTKSVFASYVMLLAQQGKFDLDTPVARQLPRPLDQYEPYRQSASELVKDPAWAGVTPRMLLSHSAGLMNFAFLEPDQKLHLHSVPGNEFRYSGEGINLVQFLVEQQQGKPLDRLMQDALFTPLGMGSTSLVYRKDLGDDVADRFDAAGKFLSQTRRDHPRGAGSMTSTAADLARFDMALMDGKILNAPAREAMLTPVIRIRSLHQFPLSPGEGEGKEAEDVGLAYGIGWGLLTKTPYGPAFFKEGHGDGAQNYMICFTQQQSCMILLTNSDNGELAFRALLEHIFGDTVTPWEWEGYTPSFIEASRKNQ